MASLKLILDVAPRVAQAKTLIRMLSLRTSLWESKSKKRMQRSKQNSSSRRAILTRYQRHLIKRGRETERVSTFISTKNEQHHQNWRSLRKRR